MNPGQSLGGAPDAHFSPLRILGFLLLQGFVFLSCSRLSDLYLASLHLPLILGLMALFLMALSGGFLRAASTTAGKLLFAFTAWMICIVPFSTWKGGSVMMLQEDWSRSFNCFLLVAGLTATLADCRRMFAVLVCGSTLAAALALIKNHRPSGRLSLPVGLFSNANDMAQMLLFALPLALFFWGKGLLRSGFAFGASGILLLAIIGSGSRSALIAIAVMLLIFYFRASAGQRLLLVSAVLALFVAALLILPRTTLLRYTTILGSSNNVAIAESQEEAQILTQNAIALDSSRSRKELLFMSLELTLYNPIFGVGPGVFPVAASNLSQERGERSKWLETHNTYTQVSSETGLPGLAIYAAVVIFCFRSILRLDREARKDKRFTEIAQMAQFMLYALTGYAVTAFFSSVAYKFMFPMIFGLAVALIRTGTLQMAAAPRKTPPDAPQAHRKTPRSLLHPAVASLQARPVL